MNRSARKWWWWFPFWMMWFVETIQLHPICAAAPPYRVDKFLYHYSDCTNSDPSIPFLAFDSETSQNLMPEHDFPSGSWENSGLRSCPMCPDIHEDHRTFEQNPTIMPYDFSALHCNYLMRRQVPVVITTGTRGICMSKSETCCWNEGDPSGWWTHVLDRWCVTILRGNLNFPTLQP